MESQKALKKDFDVHISNAISGNKWFRYLFCKMDSVRREQFKKEHMSGLEEPEEKPVLGETNFKMNQL